MHIFSRGEGIPLLVLPGWTGHSEFMEYRYDHMLADQGFRRIYIDPPGHGHTSGYNYLNNVDEYFLCVKEQVQKETGDSPFAALGFSMGGFIARSLSMELKQQSLGLAMLAPVITLPYEHRDLPEPEIFVDELEGEKLSPLEEMYMDTPLRTRRMLDFIRSGPQPVMNEANTRLLDRLFLPDNYRTSFNPDSHAERYRQPVLCITGRQDHIVGFRQAGSLCQRYPHATSVVFDRAGHWLDERDNAIKVLLQDWLQTLKSQQQ